MSERRFALVIASYQYDDVYLRQLVAPAQDAEALAQILEKPDIGGFEVQTLINEPSYKANRAIEAFFDSQQRDDLLLLYFSGHGVKDVEGRLYFATPDTSRRRLRTTAIPANLVNDVMRSSRSRRQVLLLDCCYSGAFAKGFKAQRTVGSPVGINDQLGARGRVVMTASTALQYAFEGDEVKGEGVRSVFTNALVEGLESGRADLDGDGDVSLDELYDYVYDRVTEATPHQIPEKSELGVRGNIIIARNPNPVVKSAELPPELQQSIQDIRTWVREGAVLELGHLMRSSDPGIAQAARDALKVMAADDSRRVSNEAARILEAYAEETGDQEDSVPPQPPAPPSKLRLAKSVISQTASKLFPVRLWGYRRLAVLILLLLGFVGPWVGCRESQTDVDPMRLASIMDPNDDGLFRLILAPVFLLFVFTLLRLGLQRLQRSGLLVWLERITAAASVVSAGYALVILVSGYAYYTILWGLWSMFAGILVASTNIVGELISGDYRAEKTSRREWILIGSIAIVVIIYTVWFVSPGFR